MTRRSPDGPALPYWLLEELYSTFGDVLRLVWDREHKHWLLQHRHRETDPESSFWTFCTWRHDMMDRRLISTLRKWDTRNDTPESLAAEDALWDLKDEVEQRARLSKVDVEKPAWALEKDLNAGLSYPLKIRPVPGADLVRPSVGEAALFGKGGGRGPLSEELVKQALSVEN